MTGGGGSERGWEGNTLVMQSELEPPSQSGQILVTQRRGCGVCFPTNWVSHTLQPLPMPEIFGLVPAHNFLSPLPPPPLLSGNSVTFLHLFILTSTLLFSSLHSFFCLLFGDVPVSPSHHCCSPFSVSYQIAISFSPGPRLQTSVLVPVSLLMVLRFAVKCVGGEKKIFSQKKKKITYHFFQSWFSACRDGFALSSVTECL